MNREMKAALDNALNEILLMSPEEFLAEARSIESGSVYEFFMESHKFVGFDIKELEPLQLQFSETMLQNTVKGFEQTILQESQTASIPFEQVEYALAA